MVPGREAVEEEADWAVEGPEAVVVPEREADEDWAVEGSEAAVVLVREEGAD